MRQVGVFLISLVTLVSFTTKTDPHDITEILLKVALNTINLTLCKLKKKLGTWTKFIMLLLRSRNWLCTWYRSTCIQYFSRCLDYGLKIFRGPVETVVVLGYWSPVKFYPCGRQQFLIFSNSIIGVVVGGLLQVKITRSHPWSSILLVIRNFTASSVIFQLYHGDNKFHFNEIMMSSALY